MGSGSFQDEKELVMLVIITAIFVLVTLNQTIGTIFAFMAFSYAVMLNQGRNRVLQFSKSRLRTEQFIAIFVVLGAFLGITAIVLGGQEQLSQAVTFFASSFLTNFTIDNPLVKLFVFGIFIPIAESLFFFGVVFPEVLRRARGAGNLGDHNTLITIVMVASIATAFHFTVRLLNDQALIADLIFFGLSGMLAVKYKELSVLTGLHIVANVIFVAPLVGLVPKII